MNQQQHPAQVNGWHKNVVCFCFGSLEKTPIAKTRRPFTEIAPNLLMLCPIKPLLLPAFGDLMCCPQGEAHLQVSCTEQHTEQQ